MKNLHKKRISIIYLHNNRIIEQMRGYLVITYIRIFNFNYFLGVCFLKI